MPGNFDLQSPMLPEDKMGLGFEDILFDGTTSRNVKEELLPLFPDLIVNDDNHSCSFYQGCSFDIKSN